MRLIRSGAVSSVAGLTVLAAACGSGGDVATSAGGDGDGTVAAAAPVAVEVILSDFAIEPDAIDVPAGTPITVTVMNHGQSAHTFGVVVGGETIETRASTWRARRSSRSRPSTPARTTRCAR